MTHTVRNMSGDDPASGDVRRVSSLLFLTLILLVPMPARAMNKPSGPFLFTSSSTRTTDDIEIETKVRRALGKDAQLGPLNLGVHMSGGVVQLSGPVPSAELKQRAMRIAEHVQGVLAVRTKDLYISTAAQNSKRLTILIPDDRPAQTRSASPPSPPRSSSLGQQVTLLAPEMAAPPAHPPKPARLTANPRPAPPIASLAPAIERLRQREPRFQQIRAQVRDNSVCIFPGDTSSEDVMMFAQAVRRLPGVQHVIIAFASR